jgi:hypothetical protein
MTMTRMTIFKNHKNHLRRDPSVRDAEGSSAEISRAEERWRERLG